MNKKLIIGVSAAAVAAVVIGAAAALMTSSTPEKIDLSTTHTTAVSYTHLSLPTILLV